jgi:rod shape-determining protein MreC
MSGALFSTVDNVFHFFSLVNENKRLSQENTNLRNQINEWNARFTRQSYSLNDSLNQPQYFYRQAKVINSTVSKTRNFITIDKGRKNGIVKDMAVVSVQGAVGMVWNTSDHYSTVIPIINTSMKMSGKLKSTNFFGSVEWDGISSGYAQLTEIPVHAPVSVGDSVVTSGYSAIFPENILIGEVEDVETDKGGGFYNIKIKLAVDFGSLSFVEIIENRLQKEQWLLEKTEGND